MTDLEERLVEYIEDADGLEQHMLRALDSLIEMTSDPEIRDVLMHHQEQSDRHRERLAERLDAHDATPLTVKDAGQIFVALTKEIIDRAHLGSAGKILSHGFVAEHLEITSYELLERVAKDARDFQTAEVARRNRADEEAMVARLQAGWDRSVIESTGGGPSIGAVGSPRADRACSGPSMNDEHRNHGARDDCGRNASEQMADHPGTAV